MPRAPKVPVGIRQRHTKTCTGGRCSCSWEASAYLPGEGRKVRQTFPTLAAAKAWHIDARHGAKQGTLKAPSAVTVRMAADALLEGMRDGTIQPRGGEPYKPDVTRAYAGRCRGTSSLLWGTGS